MLIDKLEKLLLNTIGRSIVEGELALKSFGFMKT